MNLWAFRPTEIQDNLFSGCCVDWLGAGTRRFSGNQPEASGTFSMDSVWYAGMSLSVVPWEGIVLVKFVVVILLLVIMASLAAALFYLIKDKGSTRRTLKALKLRIALSLAVFVLLLIGFASGWITPHGVIPVIP